LFIAGLGSLQNLGIRIQVTIYKGGMLPMNVQWSTDADGALAEAKEQKKPVLIDFSAAPA